MNSCGVDSDGLFSADIRTILEICVLPFLFSLQIQTSETAQVFLDNCLVDSSTTADTFTIIVRNPIVRISDTLLKIIKRILLTSTTSQPCS